MSLQTTSTLIRTAELNATLDFDIQATFEEPQLGRLVIDKGQDNETAKTKEVKIWTKTEREEKENSFKLLEKIKRVFEIAAIVSFVMSLPLIFLSAKVIFAKLALVSLISSAAFFILLGVTLWKIRDASRDFADQAVAKAQSAWKSCKERGEFSHLFPTIANADEARQKQWLDFCNRSFVTYIGIEPRKATRFFYQLFVFQNEEARIKDLERSAHESIESRRRLNSRDGDFSKFLKDAHIYTNRFELDMYLSRLKQEFALKQA